MSDNINNGNNNVNDEENIEKNENAAISEAEEKEDKLSGLEEFFEDDDGGEDEPENLDEEVKGKKDKKGKTGKGGKKSKKNSFKTKAFRAGGYSTFAAAIVIVIAIVINLIVSNISTAYTNVDTTSARLYSLSDQTKEIVSALTEDVTIYYVVTSDNETGYISNLLDKFKAAGSHLKVQYIDPDVNPDFVSQYTDDTVSDGDLLVVCGSKAQVVYSDDMIEYEAGSYEYYVYYLQYYSQQTAVYWKGEIQILKAIDYVTKTEDYNVYFLDVSGSTDFSVMTEALENENIINDTIEDSEDIEIPDDADCVILTNFTSDISDEARTALEEYLADGGKLYIAADYSSESMDNLTGLLAEYGISFTSATLEDGDRSYSSYSELLPEYTGEHAIISPFTSSNYVLFPDAMGIISQDTDNVTVTPLIVTSESAYLSTDDSDDLDFNQYDLGVVVDDESTGAQLVVFGTSAYAVSDYFDDSYLVNSDLFVNAIGYLCDKDSAIAIHAKMITSDSTLDFSNTSTGFITFVIAVVPALAAIIAGFVIWYKRRNT
ncbi:MAG: GldG family protein [Clostridiales bacterium]|nr:GldG family protein [Clostridiales bacterium]